MKSCFVTATDTDAGKTLVSTALLNLASQRGLRCVGYKPVSAGCEQTPEGLRNNDALSLQAASSIALEYELVNPVAFADPVAPHLAAARQQQQISMHHLQQGLDKLISMAPDLLLVEGAGGWRLPLGQGRYLSQFAQNNQLPVILVVGMKLGCLNHAMLTMEAIRADGLEVIGWVANQVDPDMLYQDENFHALQGEIDAPLLGRVPFLDDPAKAPEHLDVSVLLD